MEPIDEEEYVQACNNRDTHRREALHSMTYKLLGINEKVSIYDANKVLNQRLDDLTPLELVTLIAQANGRLGKFCLDESEDGTE